MPLGGEAFPPANVSSFWDWAVYANTVTDNWFGTGLSLMIFIIAFSALSVKYPTKQSLATSGYISVILSVMLKVMGLIGNEIILFYILITAVATFMLWREKSV